MANTSINLMLAGMQQPFNFIKSVTPTLVAGRPHSLWFLAGSPGAGVASSAGITGEILTTASGQIPFTNPVTGNTYLNGFGAYFTQAGTLRLVDRIWQNSGLDVTSTSEQVFTSSVQIPARDQNGSNAGVNVVAGVEVSVATGANTPTLTLKYTNQAGTAGQTGTNIQPTVATSAIGAFYEIALAAGDTGIQKAQSLTLSATWTSGTINTVLYRVLATIGSSVANAYVFKSGLQLGWPRLYNNTVPFLLFTPNTTTASIIGGDVVWSQG